jgi:hypothetical protein
MENLKNIFLKLSLLRTQNTLKFHTCNSRKNSLVQSLCESGIIQMTHIYKYDYKMDVII